MGNAEMPGTAQDRQAIVDEQRARWVERQILAQRVPELRRLLRIAIVVGADQAIEPGPQFDLLQLERQRVAVGVGDQHHALASLAQRREELVGAGSEGDQLGYLTLHLADRQVQFACPVVQAIPGELADVFVEQRRELQFGHGAADAVQFGIALRQQLEPEVIVEVKIQQGAVHVEQDGIDVGPGQGGDHGRLKRPSMGGQGVQLVAKRSRPVQEHGL